MILQSRCMYTAKQQQNKARQLTSFLSKAMAKKALTCAEYSLTGSRIQLDGQQNTEYKEYLLAKDNIRKGQEVTCLSISFIILQP